MEKRYQVFVSSTYEDLLAARQEVMQALLELDCIPAGMELFPAADDDQWTLIKQVIDDCDYYIVIVGGRYGTIGPESISYTQMEYEYAISKGLPIIAFLHKEPEILPAKNTEKDPKNIKKLEAFRLLVQKKTVKYWAEPADLGSAVSRSLIKLIKTNPAVGWVKADLLPPIEATEEILNLRKKIEILEIEIASQNEASPKSAEHLAQDNDMVRIRFEFKASTDSYATESFTSSHTFTWNQIFANISPHLIDEAHDRQLITSLNDMIALVEYPHLMGQPQFKDRRLSYFNINNDDYNTIKVQFLALKLIQKSVKNRSVKDKSNYWTLTSHGDTVMTELRAIKRLNTPP